MAENFSLVCNNKKVWEFYKEHSNLDFEAMNVIFTDIMENLFQDMNSSISTSLASQLLTSIQGLQNQVNGMQNISDHINTHLTNKLADFKRDYMEDVKLIISSNNAEKIAPLIKECNNTLLDKTFIMMNDVLPKNNDSLNAKIQESIKGFHDAIAEDTDKLLKSTMNQTSIESFFSSMENKLAGAIGQSQQLVSSMLTASEQRLNSRITEIKTSTESHIHEIKDLSTANQSSNVVLQNNVNDLLKKMEGSSTKGKCSENILFSILESLFPSAQVDVVGEQKETGDIMLIRKNKPTILVENKNWSRNVVQEEVKKFIRDVEIQKCCGLFLSQNNGIANKENFEINVHEGNVLLYVHEVNNDAEKIRIAIDVIDNFKTKLDEMVSNNGDGFTVEKEILDEINREYQNFALQKLSQIKNIKEFSQKLIKQIEETQFPILENYLSTRYAFSSSKYVCEYCQYVAKNQSAMSAHKRGCKNKINDSSTVENIEPIEVVQPIIDLSSSLEINKKQPKIEKKVKKASIING
jgi:hypothetical protein